MISDISSSQKSGTSSRRRLSEVAHRTRQIVYFLDPFLAGGPRFLLVAFFQSSSESSGSELSTRFLRPGAPRPPRAPFFLPGDFFPGLYSSSLPPSYQSNFVNTILFFSRFLCSFFLLLFYLFLSSFCFVLFSSLREGTFKRLLPFYFNIFYSKQCYMISGKCVLRFFFF